MLLILPEYAERPRAWQKRDMIFVVVVDNISIGIGACKSSSTYTYRES